MPVSRTLAFAVLSFTLVLAFAPAGAGQISVAGFVFDADAAPDHATPLPGSEPGFSGGLTGCATAPVLPGLSLQESVATVLTDGGVDEWIFGRARVQLDFVDNVVVNGPGPDLVVFEVGGAESFSLRVFHDSICEYGSPITFGVSPTGFTVDPCGGTPQPINVAQIELSAFGVLPGASVRRVLLDNLGAPGGAVGADILMVVARNSAPPVSSGPSCLSIFQQGIDSGAGLYLGAADTCLAADQAATSFGDAPLAYVDGNPEYNLLMRFDGLVGPGSGQVPPGATIQKATLTVLTGPGAAASTGSHGVHRLLQPWDAATATYATAFGGDGVEANGVEAVAAATATLAPMGASSLQAVDVTTAVQAWADGEPNHGFALITASSDGLGLHLAEAALETLRPSLTVQLSRDIGYAEVVAAFDPAISGGNPIACNLDSSLALGPPNYVAGSTGCCGTVQSYVSLGAGGSITLEFVEISISGDGSLEPDLWIFEVGPDVEDTFVELSDDGATWHPVGKVLGSTSSLDIDALGFGPLDLFRYVRLTDDPLEGQLTGCSVGADIDAVAALAPNPWVSLGGGVAGSAGLPRLSASGALAADGSIQLAIDGGLPGGAAILVLGVTQLSAPFKGGVMVPSPQTLIAGLPLGPAGAISLLATWPAGVPAGLPLLVQAWIPDAGGPVGFSATNALKSVTQ